MRLRRVPRVFPSIAASYSTIILASFSPGRSPPPSIAQLSSLILSLTPRSSLAHPLPSLFTLILALLSSLALISRAKQTADAMAIILPAALAAAIGVVVLAVIHNLGRLQRLPLYISAVVFLVSSGMLLA